MQVAAQDAAQPATCDHYATLFLATMSSAHQRRAEAAAKKALHRHVRAVQLLMSQDVDVPEGLKLLFVKCFRGFGAFCSSMDGFSGQEALEYTLARSDVRTKTSFTFARVSL